MGQPRERLALRITAISRSGSRNLSSVASPSTVRQFQGRVALGQCQRPRYRVALSNRDRDGQPEGRGDGQGMRDSVRRIRPEGRRDIPAGGPLRL